MIRITEIMGLLNRSENGMRLGIRLKQYISCVYPIHYEEPHI